MSIGPKFVELTADVLDFFYKIVVDYLCIYDRRGNSKKLREMFWVF